MNVTFANAVINQEERTENGMKTRKGSANSNVDLFFKIGAGRNVDLVPQFIAALVEDKELALRILQWSRDIRGGAGERETFRKLLLHLSQTDFANCKKIMNKVSEIGRWDDLLIFPHESNAEKYAFSLIENGLRIGNGLCAKWMPRKGYHFDALQKHLGVSPKQYRKLLVSLTNVVENKMCKSLWKEINYEHVPSVASSRYRSAFSRHNPEGFLQFVEEVKKGEKKINANAIFPHDVIKSVNIYSRLSEEETAFIVAQWDALPNPFGEEGCQILPMVDVSGSMTISAGKSKTSCLDIAVSLGLFCADKNKGKFNGTFLTFSESPELVHLKGDVVQKRHQMMQSKWDMNTNLHAAFDKVLKVAKDGNVPNSEMPKAILILSDMQFDLCAHYDDSAIQMIERKYLESGYSIPSIIFWNLRESSGVPVSFDKRGTALISGFSPQILSAILSSDLESISPESIMKKAIMMDRYALNL